MVLELPSGSAVFCSERLWLSAVRPRMGVVPRADLQ